MKDISHLNWIYARQLWSFKWFHEVRPCIPFISVVRFYKSIGGIGAVQWISLVSLYGRKILWRVSAHCAPLSVALTYFNFSSFFYEVVCHLAASDNLTLSYINTPVYNVPSTPNGAIFCGSFVWSVVYHSFGRSNGLCFLTIVLFRESAYNIQR